MDQIGALDRVERLERELAVRRLVDRYAHGCDANDPAAVAALFDDEGALLVRDAVYTGDEIAAFYRGRLDLTTLHFVAGLAVDERADGLIDATCGFVAIEIPPSGARLVIGRYTDVVRVENGAGHFVSRRIDVTHKVPSTSPAH